MNRAGTDSSFYTQVIRSLFVFAFIVSVITPTVAQGDLLIYPKRVVLEGRTTIEKLTLANTGKDTAVYNISFLEYKMNENGELKIITEPEEGINFASSCVRVFPRKVVLAPGESQKVKVQLRNSQLLPDGEYRSHLYFRAEEDKGALGETKKTNDSTISVKLQPVFGLSIACIVRKGTNTTTVSISDLKYITLKDHGDALQFKLNRSGNMSAYGDFTVNYVATDNTVTEIANLKGVGIYTPGAYRNIIIKLSKPEIADFSGGTLQLIFTQNESKVVLAEAELKF